MKGPSRFGILGSTVLVRVFPQRTFFSLKRRGFCPKGVLVEPCIEVSWFVSEFGCGHGFVGSEMLWVCLDSSEKCYYIEGWERVICMKSSGCDL